MAIDARVSGRMGGSGRPIFRNRPVYGAFYGCSRKNWRGCEQLAQEMLCILLPVACKYTGVIGDRQYCKGEHVMNPSQGGCVMAAWSGQTVGEFADGWVYVEVDGAERDDFRHPAGKGVGRDLRGRWIFRSEGFNLHVASSPVLFVSSGGGAGRP